MKIKTLSLLAAGFLAGGMFCQQAQAMPISGKIGINGDFSTDTGSVNTTTLINFLNGNVSGTPTGHFSAIANGTVVTMGTPLVFATPALNNPLWSVGGFTFDLVSVVVNQTIPGFILISGSGIVDDGIGGLDATAGKWTFTGNDGGAAFTFSSGTSVPEGGLTIAFLGSALVGLGMLRRRLS